MSSHWHPALRPDVYDHEHEDIRLPELGGIEQESIAVTRDIEQHGEVAPPVHQEEAHVIADERRTSWAQTATHSVDGEDEESGMREWSMGDTETFASSMMQEEMNSRADERAGGEEGPASEAEGDAAVTTAYEVEPDMEATVSVEDMAGKPLDGGEEEKERPGVGTEAAIEDHQGSQQEEHHSNGYDYQGDVTQMDEAVGEAPSAPLLLDEEAPPTIEESAAQEESSIVEEFDGASAPGQPLPKSQAAPTLDRSFTSNFTELPRHHLEQERNLPTQSSQPMSEGWPAVGDDKTFGELLGDNVPATAQEIVGDEKSADDGWAAVGEDEAFSQLRSHPLAADDGLGITAGSGEQVHASQEHADDPWGAAVDEDAFGDLQVQQKSEPADDPWGATADDSAFSELVGQRDSTTEEAAQQPETTSAEAKPEEDLAAMWQAALDDDELLDESTDLDPSTFFGDDDDGFLLDDGDDVLTSTPVPAPAPSSSTTNPYVPAQVSARNSPQVNPYTVPSAQPMGQAIGRAGGTPSTGLFDVYGHSQPVQSQQRPSAQSAQSFADKNKGGYESPYDLPMDVVKQPRQRPRQPQAPTSSGQAVPTPPPRSASMISQPGVNPAVPEVSGAISGAPLPSVSGATPSKTTPRSTSGFFEDLPMAPRPRPRPSPSGAYTPQSQSPSMPPPGQAPPTQLPPKGPMAPPMQPPQRPEAPPAPAQQSVYGGFQQPARLPLLPEQPTAPQQNHMQPPAVPSQSHRYSPSLPTTSSTQNRFSPAPHSQGPPAGNASRYSPAPGAQQKRPAVGPTNAHIPPGVQQGHPFAPRTSSPLAFHTDKPHPPLPHEYRNSSLPSSPPMANGSQTPMSMSPDRKVSTGYSPYEQRTPASQLASPPARPATQSPPTAMKQARHSMPAPERSTSTTAVSKIHLQHRRNFSRDLPFVEPNDERAHDPLQRWKGQPIFRWSNSGSVVSSLPKQTPFYAAGHGIPSIKCTPGDISIQNATTFMPMDDRNARFPGPLTSKAKGRKKEVVAWMAGKIEDLESAAEAVRMDFNMDSHLKKRVEEKRVLWKLVKIFVDHDGVLEGNQKIDEEVRAVLLPDLAQMAQGMETSGTPGAQADPVDRAVVVQIRQALLEGQRERAVWLAEEKKLWGHAMLLASTMGPEVWKQIIQSFVRSQVKTVGSDARSLAALYQVFAGNAEECVDELVPPSARAGFQMVSKSDGIATGNPLEGLDQWRETLGLVAGNRIPNDTQSMLALGKLLGGYGRAEAAHACFLFARHIAKHSGADDTDVSFVILGADHTSGNFSNDIDSILLTEIYEWASSLSGTQTYVPHLQSFKLIHAQNLAAHGLTSKAQAYCDHITSAYQSTTRPSQYYHPTFTSAVADLSAFLSQSPHAGKQGLINTKTMNKVSSGAASWFTKFVSGDDGADGAASHGGPGGEQDSTPFGRVNGDSSANLSRSASGTELYNPMMGGGMPLTSSLYGVSTPSAFGQAPPTSGYMPNTSAPSKYAPGAVGGNKYAPAGGLPADQPFAAAGGSKYSPAGTTANLGMPAEIQSRPASTRGARSYTPAPVASSSMTQPLAVPGRPIANRAASAYSADSRSGSVQFGSPSGSYQPSPQGSYQPSPMGSYQPGSSIATPQEVTSQPQQVVEYGYQAQAPQASEAAFGYQPQLAGSASEPGQGSYGYQSHALAAPQGNLEEQDDEEDPFARPPPQSFDEPGVEDAEGGGYEPPAASAGDEQLSASAAYEPSPAAANTYSPPSTYGSGYEPPSTNTGGYEPPSASGGYEPPSYQPYNPDDEAAEEDQHPKPRKSIMDDDDEDDASALAARAAAIQKAAADKAADDAFRAAAEADAAKDDKKHSNNQSLGGGPGEKKGWFGGWFKKDPNAAAQQGNGPIRAKLGEENSFYYDEELKKWVNKKGGAEDSSKANVGTPPPPRASGPPSSRAVSGVPPAGPPSSEGPPSRNVSNNLSPSGSGPPSRIGTPAEGGSMPPMISAVPSGLGSGPPSRPSTGMSNASSLDDLLGGPPARKVGGSTVKKKKGGRYVDVMAK